jgi:cell shape-determining protein MreD
LIALVLERSLGTVFSITYLPMPFFVAVAIFWLWRLSGSERFWFGVIAGFIMDSLSPLPFGVYGGSFLILVALAIFFQFFFSNITSSFIQSASMGLQLLVFFITLPVLTTLIQYMTGFAHGGFLFSVYDYVLVSIGAITWSTLFILVSFAAIEWLRDEF